MLDQFNKAATRSLGALVFLSFPLFLAGCDPSPGDRFPGPWIEARSAGIDRVLGDHNVSGCENLAYRPSNVSSGPLDPRGDFLVYCSADGSNWTGYIVRPGLARNNSLEGPFEIYSDVAPP